MGGDCSLGGGVLEDGLQTILNVEQTSEMREGGSATAWGRGGGGWAPKECEWQTGNKCGRDEVARGGCYKKRPLDIPANLIVART